MADESYRFKVGKHGKQGISVTVTEFLGRGGFGVVHKVKDKHDGTYYAMKVITYSDTSTEKSAKIEQMALEQMDHDNIVRIYAASKDRFVTERRLLMEFCEGGTLNSKLAEKTSDEVERKWMLQISDAVRYLHDKNIVHRDLKPENILLTATLNAKVADFGLAKAFMISEIISDDGGPYMETRAGSSLWMAPEVFRREYTAKADVFSLGTVLYGIRERTFSETNGKRYYGAFVMGKTPADGPIALGDAIAHHGVISGIGNLQFPLNGLQSTVSKLILTMLRYEYKKRPSARHVHEVLKMINLKRNEIQKRVPKHIWDQTLEISEGNKESQRKFQAIASDVSQEVSIELSNLIKEEYDIDVDFSSKQEDVFKEITNFSHNNLGRSGQSRSLQAKAVAEEEKHTNLVSEDFVDKGILGSPAGTRNNENVREKRIIQGKKTKKSSISSKGPTVRKTGRNIISNEVRDISLDCNRYSSITENAENENNEQTINVEDDKITPFCEDLPSGSNVNIPVPGIAPKSDPMHSDEETATCGDRPSLKIGIAINDNDGKRQINTTRPTARGGSLPSQRSTMISKSASKNSYGEGEDTYFHVNTSGSDAKIPRFDDERRGRNSVNENGTNVPFIDLTRSSASETQVHAGEVQNKRVYSDKSDPVGEIILISQDSSIQAANPSEEDLTSTSDAASDDSVSILQ
eukprot:Seg1031.6 transcript_id=Seg1031.6/GoldUCD/mRNA.D3Y31 product="Serine/threonine-protein kinase Nek4" protein_id=Seg1031.6/GoldUCD/D3Y31